MFCNPQNLSKEQQTALDVLKKNLTNNSKNISLRAIDINFEITTEENSCFFYDGHLAASRIPKKIGWKWNQSRSKVELLSVGGEFKLSFFKLNTRKDPGTDLSNIPHFKVWIFNITNTISSAKSSFFWCEKGFVTTEYLDDELLVNLSFLAEFVSQKDAFEFGWIDKNPECTNLDFSWLANSYVNPFLF